jgi:hypothetical protein
MLSVRVLGLLLLLFAKTAQAQESIQIETNQVLVPVRVIDNDRNLRLWADPSRLDRAMQDGDTQLAEHIFESASVSDLKASDFRIFDDDKPQVIEDVTYQRSSYWNLRDNLGHHTEFLGFGGGKWSTAEWAVAGTRT